MKFTKIDKNLAIKYLKGPGKAFVLTQLTTDDDYFVEVKKSSLINVLENHMGHGVLVEFGVTYSDDNSAYMHFGV